LKFVFDRSEGWAYMDFGRTFIHPTDQEIEAIVKDAIDEVRKSNYGKYKFLKTLEPERARVLIEMYGDVY
jgi:hypothetical protein